MAEMIAIAAYKIQSPFDASVTAFSRWNNARKTRKTLLKLSADQLADIGLDFDSVRKIR